MISKRLLFRLFIQLLVIIIGGCEKEEGEDPIIDESYFDGFQLIESLDGNTDVELNSVIRFTTGNFSGIPGEKYREYRVFLNFYDSLGRFMGSRCKLISSYFNMYKIELSPLLQNKKYFYKVILTKSSNCDDPFWDSYDYFEIKLEFPDIYRFKTKKINNVSEVNDVVGNVYETVEIGDQVWFVQNLNTNKYSDSSDLDFSFWNYNYSIKDFPYFNFSKYPSAAIKEDKNICPDGWHVPSVNEFDTLFNTLQKLYGENYIEEMVCQSTNATYLSFDAYGSSYWTSTRQDSILLKYTFNCWGFREYEYEVYKEPEDQNLYDETYIRCIKD